MTPHEEAAAMVKIGHAIKKGREELGWGVAQLASVAYMSEHQVARLEQGTLRDEGLRKTLVQALKNHGIKFEDGIEGTLANE